MKYKSCLVALFLGLFLVGSKSANVFRFANIYGDQMVLQRAPKQAMIWGFGEIGQQVSLHLSTDEQNSPPYSAEVTKLHDNTGVWFVKLDPKTPAGPITIVATSHVNSREQSINLTDVLFGDVWICGGEHNMEMPVRWATHAENTIKSSSHYSDIRLFTVGNSSSESRHHEIEHVRQNWTKASPDNVGGKKESFFLTDRKEYYFSAVCWNYAVQLYDKLKYPIGVISSNWNGSIEAWSSPDALKKCNITNGVLDCENPPYFKRSHLWNAMISPLTKMTIYGVIWYQGETNALLNSNPYKCMFLAMIDDWRAKWSSNSKNTTDKEFPFGFVQLSSVGRDMSSQKRNFAQLRWDQTAGYGYVPNERQKKVFMAVSMDLGNPFSPFKSRYPTDKKDVGIRLALAALNVAYDKKQMYYSGPLVKNIKQISKKGEVTRLKISYKKDSIYKERIQVKQKQEFPAAGFEVLCHECDIWMAANITDCRLTSVVITPSVDCYVKEVRYSWSDYPCVFKECPIYSDGFPSPPFIKKVC